MEGHIVWEWKIKGKEYKILFLIHNEISYNKFCFSVYKENSYGYTESE